MDARRISALLQRLDALLERAARARQAWLKAKAASDERRRLLIGTEGNWHRKLDEWLIHREEKIMNMNKPSQDKLEKPSTNFKTAHEVVADPALSRPEKEEALDTLEQDAHLLATASAEGMTGGEPTNLHEVLDAKEALALQPTTYAYEVVLRDLKTRQAAGPQERTQALIKHAIEALEALERADVAQASTAPGNPTPGSDEEIAKEAETEKLDP
jgi:hypothetical protein